MFGWLFGRRREIHVPGLTEVLRVARVEAGRRRHEYVGTEHLLFALLSLPDRPVSRALASSGVLESEIWEGFDDLLGVRRGPIRHVGVFATLEWEIDDVVGPNQAVANEQESALFLTPRAERAIQFAAKEAEARGHATVEPEHLLLGLIAETEGVASVLLEHLGVDLDLLAFSVTIETGWGKK